MIIKIRPLTEQDAYTSYKWRNIPDVWALTERSWDREITSNDELNWMRKVLADESSLRFAIEADGCYVGNIYLTDIVGRSAQYHIFIGDVSAWGKGIGRSASKLILEEARQLSLHTVWLTVKTANLAAIRLYQSLGFDIVSEEGGSARMELALVKQGHPDAGCDARGERTADNGCSRPTN